MDNIFDSLKSTWVQAKPYAIGAGISVVAACLFLYLKQKPAEASRILSEHSTLVRDSMISEKSESYAETETQNSKLARSKLIEILEQIPDSFQNFAWQLRDDFRRQRRQLRQVEEMVMKFISKLI